MASAGSSDVLDVVVIGGGQSGLAAGYYLRRAGLRFAILDASDAPGGAWRHTWPSLRLFSPAAYSSLPGRPMPPECDGAAPDAAHVIDYLTDYESRYDLPVHRGVRVVGVARGEDGFTVRSATAQWRARAVISATGTWSRPFVPYYPGSAAYEGRMLHSSAYAGPGDLRGDRVLVVGGGNSGAQIAADLAEDCAVTWCTLDRPRFLPDDVDGSELFRLATARVRGDGPTIGSPGDIVVVPPVRRARDAGLLRGYRMFDRLVRTGAQWSDGSVLVFDSIVWCTGFRSELRHLRGLSTDLASVRLHTDSTPRVPSVAGLYLLGYGDWCGPASATLIGVGQYAKGIVGEIAGHPRSLRPATTPRW